MDHDRVRVLGLDDLDALPDRLARRGELGPVLERRHDVGRGHLLAVVEADALAQRDRVAPSAVPHRVPFGEHRDRAHVLVIGVERLVHVPRDLLRDHGGRRVEVERRRLADHPGLERAADARLLLRRRGAAGGQKSEHEDGGDSKNHG